MPTDADARTIRIVGATRATYMRTAVGPWLRPRAATLFCWIGLLLVLALGSLTIDRSGSAPTQRTWVYGRLNQAHTYGQTFVVERDTLVAVRVLLFAGPTSREDPVTFRLRYAEGDLPDLASVTLPLRALDRREMTTFTFPPLTLNFPADVVTTTLRFDLEAPTLPPGEWITVMAGPDTYGGGLLFVDGSTRPEVDLAFQPIYRHSWLDMLLPVSRMAHNKQGLLGWPSFYALLAYAFCLLLGYVLVQFWRVARSSR